jgi:hypothetical protein
MLSRRPEMKSRSFILALVIILAGTTAAWADQLILKSGKEYSGKFVRGDSSVVEFRVLGRIETFKTADVSQILFKEPELVNPPSGSSESSGAVPPPAPAPAQAPSEPAPTAPAPSPTRAASDAQRAREVPPQEAGPSVTLPENTPITIRTAEAIDTDRNRVGDSFDATLEEPLTVDGRTLAAKGTQVKGNIARAKESGTFSGQSELILELTELQLNGRTYALQTSDYTEIGSSRSKQTAGAVGGGAAVGAIIGAIAGGGKGAAVGAAAGAAVGTGVQVLTRGQTLKVPSETVLEFHLQHPLTLDVP